MLAVRSLNKGPKVVIVDAAKRKLKRSEVNKLAPLPACRLLGVRVHPDHAVHMECGGVGLTGVLLCMLHAVDTLVLLEVCLGGEPAAKVEVCRAVLVAAADGGPSPGALRAVQRAAPAWEGGQPCANILIVILSSGEARLTCSRDDILQGAVDSLIDLTAP